MCTTNDRIEGNTRTPDIKNGPLRNRESGESPLARFRDNEGDEKRTMSAVPQCGRGWGG
jgi:hypothetical protein